LAAIRIGASMLALAVMAPADAAEFKSMPLPLEPDPRAGTVPLSPGQRPSASELEHALRADAARLWQRSDGGDGLSVRVEAVTWRDGALGCPLPDRLYTQAAVDGWRVVVGDGSRELDYHVSADGRWLLCPANRTQPPLPKPLVR
jgi:hypothetical protein